MKYRSRLFYLVPVLVGLVACNRDPNAVKNKYLEAGNRYYKNGKFKEASIMYRNALRRDKMFGEAYYRLALAESELRRWGEAVAAFRRAVELQPENEDAHAKLADILLAAYRQDPAHPPRVLEDAAQLSNALLKRSDKSFHGHRLAAHVASLKGDLKGAIAEFNKANEIRPMQPEVTLPLVQALFLDRQTAEGERIAKAAIEKEPKLSAMYDALYMSYVRQNRPLEAEETLKLKLRNIPNSATAVLQLAAFYYGTGRRPEMLKTLQSMLDKPKEFPNARIDVGDFYFRLREFDQAIQQYQAGEQAQPAMKNEYRKRIAETLIFSGKRTEAAQLLDTVLKDAPQDEVAIAMRSSLLLQTGDRQQIRTAIQNLESLLRRMPDNAVLRFELGRAYLAYGDQERARVQFEEAAKLRPDYTLPRLALAQLHLAKGDFTKANQIAQQVLERNPGNLPARLLQTGTLIGMGDKAKARAELTALLKAQPDARDGIFQLAMLDFSDRNYKAAEDAFRRLHQLIPPDPRGLMGLTEVYLAQGKMDAAAQVLKDQLAKHPESTDIKLGLANVEVRSAKYDEAITLYQQLIQKSPERSDLYLRLAETYRRKGDLKSALDTFSLARKVAPNDPMPHLQAALLLEGLGQRDQARPLYEQVLKLEPDNPIALNNLAYAMAEQGTDLDQALTLAQRAKQKLPQDQNIADTLGWIYIKKNLSDNAIQIFQELTRQSPNHPVFRYHLAMALFQKGDRPGAKKELEAALRNKPNKEDEAKIRELMARIG